MATEFYPFSAFVAQGGTDADLPSLEAETRAADAGLDTKLDYTEKTPAGAPTGVTFTFSVALTAGEKTTLDGVVAAHLGTPTVASDPIVENTTPVDGQLVVYDSNASPQSGYVNRTISGDVTIDVAGSVTIASDAVTYDKIQDVVANNVFLGNDDGAGSTVQELTGTEATVLLDVFTAALKGLAPASGGGTTNFLRADGTWAAPSCSYSTSHWPHGWAVLPVSACFSPLVATRWSWNTPATSTPVITSSSPPTCWATS